VNPSRRRWPLPEKDDTGGFRPGAIVRLEKDEPLVLRDLDGLLEDLGERIFEAERIPGQEGEQEGARLLAETAWSLGGAARFALDCVDHIVGGSSELKLPGGASVTELIEQARRFLEEGDEKHSGLLQSVSRLALARRLKQQGDDVADVALRFAVEDEAADEDTFSDPAWTAAASLRDALLAAVEALRHEALPSLVEGENLLYERDEAAASPEPELISTPWGNFTGGGLKGVVPAWIAAQDAAARARQAMADTAGPAAGEAERAYQKELLAKALGITPRG
jgi:hypothetical protein